MQDKKDISYLALGDSYTIGESVPIWENFPSLLVQTIRNKIAVNIAGPEIIAKSAYTTTELQAVLDKHVFKGDGYDLVTLLIGVNDQYRGYPLEQFQCTFEPLLQTAIKQARGLACNVVVLSIPDWGASRHFREKNMDSVKTTKEINDFNLIIQNFAEKYRFRLVEITEHSRMVLEDQTFQAEDGIHFSAKEHQIWVDKIVQTIIENKIL